MATPEPLAAPPGGQNQIVAIDEGISSTNQSTKPSGSGSEDKKSYCLSSDLEPYLAQLSGSGSRDKKIYCLPTHIEPDHAHFKPIELRLGLHTHPELDTTLAGMDGFKVQVVQEMAGEKPLESAQWKKFAREALKFVRKESQGVDAQALYGLAPPHDPTSTQPGPEEVLVLDALFLCVYLCHISGKLSDLRLLKECGKIFRVTEFGARRFSLYRDLMVMENQLPMSLMLAVMKQLIPGTDTLKAAEAMLNNVLTDVGLAVYPFAHGDKLRNRSRWKKELKALVEKHHECDRVDALWKCSHILASTYMVICGAYYPNVEEESCCCCKPSAQQTQCFCCKPSAQQQQEEEEDEQDLIEDVKQLQSASSLKKCGIKFKPVHSPFRLDTITFKQGALFKKGTLRLPKLVMDDHTASLFRNLALYEQVLYEQAENSSNWYRSDFRYYLNLMDCLIDTPEDVRILVDSKVLVNQLGSEEVVSNEWNSMCKGLFLSTPVPQYRKSLQRRIDAHLRNRSNMWFAEFRAVHCNSPFRVLAFLAVVLVAAATVGSFVIAYLDHRKNSKK